MQWLVVRRRQQGSRDAHGNTVTTYAPPTTWAVFGWAPGTSDEGGENRDLSKIAWTVYAPASDQTPTEYDRVELGGQTYEVDGHPADWTHGPWPHPTAGVVVLLKRTEG